MKSSTRSLTEGPLAKQILLVSLPLALSNLLQVLFNMSDVAVVGRFAGSTALGAVGSTSIFVTLFTGFLIGLSNGINVLVARFYGARHPNDVHDTVHSALIVSLIAGVILLVVACWAPLPCCGCCMAGEPSRPMSNSITPATALIMAAEWTVFSTSLGWRAP